MMRDVSLALLYFSYFLLNVPLPSLGLTDAAETSLFQLAARGKDTTDDEEFLTAVSSVFVLLLLTFFTSI